MQALLSPHSCTALAFQDQKTFLVFRGKSPQALQPADVVAWLSAHEETSWQQGENWGQVEHALSLYSRRREALDLALIGLDDDLSLELRDEAQQELESLLADPAVADWLLNLFHLRPLPSEAAVDDALSQARTPQRRRVRDCLETIVRRQELIAKSWAAWSVIPEGLLHSGGGRQAVVDVALQKDLFVRTLGLLVERQVDKAKFSALLCLQTLAGGRQIVEAWLHPLITVNRHQRMPIMEVEARQRKEAKAKPQKQARYDRDAARRYVEEQKTKIIRSMRSGQWEKASLAVDGMLNYQRRFGGGSYAAKSLCDLAVEAKALGQHRFQLELTSRAIEQNPEDGWAWVQYGNALLINGQLQKAFDAFENGVSFGTLLYGKTGRAEVLKAQSSYSEALTNYAEIILDYPYEVVPQNGRAEVLKAMGRYPEALAAYEATIEAHPQNVVSKAGRAEVLKAMGRYPEALEAYDDIVEAYPQDAVPNNGRAEVLKIIGRYPEALETYEATIEAHPQDVFAKVGRAEVLKAMGRYPEALEAYDDIVEAYPQDAVPNSGRAEVLKIIGRYPEALEAYDATIEAHPQDVFAKVGRAEVLKAMGRYPEALEAYDATIEAHPQNVVSKAGRAEVLKSMGEIPEAARAYASVIEQHPENLVVRSGYAVVLFMLGEYSQALDLLPVTKPEPFGDWIGWHIRGMVLLRRGQIEEALPILEQGANESPAMNRDYFRTALAMAQSWQENWKSAQEQIIQVSAPELQRVGNVVWLHIHAVRDNREGMEHALTELEQGNPPALVIELTEELRLRFLEKKQGRHDRQWLRERMVDCLALAA